LLSPRPEAVTTMGRARDRQVLFGTTGLVTILSACGGTATIGVYASTTGSGGSTTTTTTTVPATTGVGGGAACGTESGYWCGPTEFCSFPDHQCGGNDGSGTCLPRPGACEKNRDATCGCDRKIYDNACAANQAGVDLSDYGRCTPPPEEFGCGPHFCALSGYYCELIVGPTFLQSYACQPLPAACGGTASCACLSSVMCGSHCNQNADGGFQVTCSGG
jgi:hypothetical protein